MIIALGRHAVDAVPYALAPDALLIIGDDESGTLSIAGDADTTTPHAIVARLCP